MSPLTRGWVVVFCGFGINLALGVLYTWSAIASALTIPATAGGQYLWTPQQANLPYAFAVMCFSLTMVFAGRLQDRIGPRWVATAGGVMVGLGMIVASLSPPRLSSTTVFPVRMVLGFGVLAGIGIGLAYASATPAAVKWFSAGKRGLVTGVVVSGFGLAAIYTAPLTNALIRAYGVSKSFVFLGVVFFVMIVGFAQLIANPPKGYVPPGSYAEELPSLGPRQAVHEYTWREVLRTPSFYVLWAMYACAAAAGLMSLGILAKVALVQLGALTATVTSAVLGAAIALGNGLGRPLGGLISDRIGRRHTMLATFVFQAVLMVGLRFATSAPLLLCAAFLIAFNYGAVLALFPATTFDFFGTRNGGVDYGLVFTAWGVGGLLGTQAVTWVVDPTHNLEAAIGSYGLVLAVSAGLCVAAAALTFVLRPPDPSAVHCPVVESGGAPQA